MFKGLFIYEGRTIEPGQVLKDIMSLIHCQRYCRFKACFSRSCENRSGIIAVGITVIQAINAFEQIQILLFDDHIVLPTIHGMKTDFSRQQLRTITFIQRFLESYNKLAELSLKDQIFLYLSSRVN